MLAKNQPLTKFPFIRTISPVQRFTLSEMNRRGKFRQHLIGRKRSKKPRTGKYWSSVKEESNKRKAGGKNGIGEVGRTKKGRRRSEPSNFEILGEIARIVTATKILSGKTRLMWRKVVLPF